MERPAHVTSDGDLDLRPTAAMVWGRAGVLGLVALLTGGVSHATAGGNLPGLAGMALLLLSCVLGAACLLLRRVSAATLTVLVLVGQTWVHGVLSAVAGHRGDVPVAPAAAQVNLPVSGGGTLLEQYRSGVQSSARPGQDWLLHQVDHFVAQGPLMLLAHLGGAALFGLFLAVGEDALWALMRLVAVRRAEQERRRGLVGTARAVSSGVALRAACLVLGRAQVPAPQVPPRSTLTRRGPPFVLTA